MNQRLVLLAGCAVLAVAGRAATPGPREGEVREAIVAGADHAANVLLDAHGQSRCDYDLLTGTWSPYEPAWHTGQLIYGLLEAYRVTHSPRYLEKARLAGDWWTSLAVTEPGPLQGMVRAVHGAGINYIVFATVTDGTAGLYQLARATGEDRYAAVPTRAGRWMLAHMYVPEQGVFYDAVDPQSGEVQKERSPFWKDKAAQELFDVARPNNEGSMFKDMYLYTHDEAFKTVFLALCDSLVAKQGPEGLWMRFTPNHAADGGFHPRFNLWYAESLLDGYEMTHDPRYLAAARKTLMFYTKYQRKNGTIYYENFLDGRANESSPSGSTVAFAGLLWLRLIQLGAGEGCEEPMQRSLAWVLHNRYPVNHPDPNLAGGFFNLRMSGKGSTMHVVYRDIGTAFALRFLAAYYRERFPSAAAGTSSAPKPAITDERQIPAYVLPDPLRSLAGQPVRDAETWRNQRRSELLDLFSREVYGRTPPGRPAHMHWAVTSIDRAALGGKAVRKEITLWFTDRKDGPQMHLLVYQPAATGAHPPWPAFLGLNFVGNAGINPDPAITLSKAWVRANPLFHVVDHHATEGTRGVQASRWQVEKVIARGYATVTAYYGDLCPDEPSGLPRGVGALFGTPGPDERQPDEWGAIGMWAWGLSRALDYLESDPDIDAHRVAVHGHSRLGKAALWAAAQDERFALVISNCSGCGGAALDKRIYGETVGLINARFPHWFSRNFRAYDDNEAALPVDQHELLALIAPRPLYVASASEDIEADPRGEFLSLMAAQPVYRLLGRRGVDAADWPAVNAPLRGDAVAYHVRAGKHDITAYDWDQYLDFADECFGRSGT